MLPWSGQHDVDSYVSPLINDSQKEESNRKLKVMYEEEAEKKFIKKEGKKNYLVPFQIA